MTKEVDILVVITTVCPTRQLSTTVYSSSTRADLTQRRCQDGYRIHRRRLHRPVSNHQGSGSPSNESQCRALVPGHSQLLRTVCLPKANDVKLFEGRAYYPVYANNLDPKSSCSWTETGDGGGYGQIVLAWADQPRLRVRSRSSSWSPRTAAGPGSPSTITRPR